MIVRCLFTCFITNQVLVTALSKDVCNNCVSVEKCVLFNNLSMAEQLRWTTEYSCDLFGITDNDAFRIMPLDKTDYICCPQNLKVFKIHLEKRTRFKRSADIYEGQNRNLNYRNRNNQRQSSENVWLNHEDNSDYLHNDRSIQNDGNYKDDGMEYESNRAPFWQRRTNNQFNNGRNQNVGSLFENPYFMKKPSVQNPSQSVNGNGNTGITKSGQCAGLTSFPPDADLGCCGRDEADSDRIIGGQTTAFDQFPWTVRLNSKFTSGRSQAEFGCGGALISSRYVLTAAHCLHDANARLSDVEIFLAEYNKLTFPRDCIIAPGEGQKCVDNVAMHAEDVTIHPQFDETRLQNDIALIRLRGAAPYTDFIRPICLPLINIDNPEFSNLPLSVAGWGRNGRFQSDVKLSTVVNLVPQRECMKHYPYLTSRHLCAAGHTGEDTCKGDSGGPLMGLHRGKYFVAGIVSGKRADSPCGSAVPSLYTNVYNYLDWIRSNIRN